VVAEDEVLALEIRWQGLRDIMNRAPDLRQQVESAYRLRLRETFLKSTPWFRGLSSEAMEEVIRETVFSSYGEYDWQASYHKLEQVTSAARRLEEEPLIASQGDYLNGLYLVISGFVRVSEKINHGERTVACLRENDQYGLDTLAHNWHHATEAQPLRHTLRAIGHVDLLVVPTAVMEKYALPRLSPAQLAELGAGPQEAVATDLFEFLVEKRLINGTAAMVIDLDRCVRCDDCVRACADTHGGNPRFVRQGPIHGALMVANACMHCTDPVCLIGCPTGAIQRDRQQGQIVINDETCIGCGTCASSCPYTNIQMVPVQTAKGEPIPHFQQPEKVQEKATKCDLCLDQMGGPACQRACPHGALRRVDLGQLTGLTEWLKR
jgi:Fe-S-cluster-containing dehydrogenase component